MTDEGGNRRPPASVGAAVAGLGKAGVRALTTALGGAERTRVIVLLAAVLALSSADASTVGASATPLRHALGINNTDIGLLVTVTSLVAALTSLPFGVLADRVRRTWVLGAAIVLWGAAMIWSATVPTFGDLLLARVFLGAVTAAAGPMVASLVGDYFPSAERGRIYGYILAGALVGVLAGGTIGDFLLHRGHLKGRILVSAIAATLAVILFAPAIFSRSALAAVPYLTFAALALSAQNPPLDAARLDIMVPLLW